MFLPQPPAFSFPSTFVLILGWFIEYAEPGPIGQPTVPLMERGGKGKFSKWMGSGNQSLDQRIRNKQNGVGRQGRPYIGE